MPIKWNDINRKTLEDQTCDATPGTRSDHAHGLGFAPDLDAIICQPLAGDNDTDAVNGSVCVIKADATNVTVKSNVASQTFNMFIFLTTDIGNQRNV